MLDIEASGGCRGPGIGPFLGDPWFGGLGNLDPKRMKSPGPFGSCYGSCLEGGRIGSCRGLQVTDGIGGAIMQDF